ncbi:MAG: response regulator transcription factor [Elusimicrobia bacterium]|nr:response regulator transcription factor [Elusimicrobiota bacterium]
MSPPRVLVVDDEHLQRRVFRRCLEMNGLKILEAGSAAAAIEIVRDAASRPDLVLCDIGMPGMDGIILAKALRTAPETSAIPVILMTGLSLPDGMMAVASDTLDVGPIFIKGDGLESLVNRVKELLEIRPNSAIAVDHVRRSIRIGGLRVPELPARRFQLLCALIRCPEGISREELLEQVWNAHDNPNVVDVTMLRLRADLKGFPALRIETKGAGYRLVIGNNKNYTL